MGRKIHRFGKATRRRRREECEARTKEPLERGNTGIRSAVRYGFQSPKEALKTPGLPEELIAWLSRRPDLTKT
jgi:hypothetical protein